MRLQKDPRILFICILLPLAALGPAQSQDPHTFPASTPKQPPCSILLMQQRALSPILIDTLKSWSWRWAAHSAMGHPKGHILFPCIPCLQLPSLCLQWQLD